MNGYRDLESEQRKQIARHSQQLEIVKSLVLAGPVRPFAVEGKRTRIETEIIRAERIRNDAREQDIRLKRRVLETLLRFLAVETLVVFIFAFLQGADDPFSFELQENTFQLMLAATILQITYMLTIAVRHLFPQAQDVRLLDS